MFSSQNPVELFVGFIGVIIILYLYFLPSVIGRDKAHRDGITILNLFLGWTFLGWVISLVWAVSSPKNPAFVAKPIRKRILSLILSITLLAGLLAIVVMLSQKMDNITKTNDPKTTTISPVQSYHDTLRNLIFQSANAAGYSGAETGNIYLILVITRDGKLKSLKVDETKSAPNKRLKQYALSAVKNISSFPPFPKEMTYAELEFKTTLNF